MPASVKPLKVLSNLEKITVDLPKLDDNGGSTILSYEL